jgi:hypothetical protein
MWKANRELCRAHSGGGLERCSSATGPYQQTRQHALLARYVDGRIERFESGEVLEPVSLFEA